MSEGDLSRLRAHYVCQETLANAARAVDLGRYIKSDRSMRASGGNNSKAILSDTIEAIIGAVFLDGGLAAAEAVTFQILGTPPMAIAVTEKDAKTRLQEIIQAEYHHAPRYVVLEESGPPHAPTFVVGVTIKDEVIAKARGENKKIAAQNAAVAALSIFTPEKQAAL
jgi:ribonuclease-3